MDQILEKLAGNPIHVYCLVERMVRQLPSVRKALALNSETFDIAEGLDRMMENVETVSEDDLVGVTQALARIQFAYRYHCLKVRANIHFFSG